MVSKIDKQIIIAITTEDIQDVSGTEYIEIMSVVELIKEKRREKKEVADGSTKKQI